MKTYFAPAFMCRECGNLTDGKSRYDFCTRCGGTSGHDQVSAEFRSGWFKDTCIGFKVTGRPSTFQIRLARLLDIEADGGDDPAAVLAELMVQAAGAKP